MKELLRQWSRKDAHPAVQFVKYGLCGGLATAVDMAIFFLAAWMVFPALSESDPLVRLFGLTASAVEEGVRSRYFVYDRLIAFLFSNGTAYVLNALWVFEGGRHRRHTEIALFLAVSAGSLAFGTALGWAMIRFFGLSTTVSYLGNVVASVLINYAGRKFFVFKG